MEEKNVDPRDREFWKELTKLRGKSMQTDNPDALSLEGSDLSTAFPKEENSLWSSSKRILKGVSIGVLAITGLVLLRSLLKGVFDKNKQAENKKDERK